MPRLSIGLPVYNGEEYLAEALASLTGQTFGDFELIISDNASTDATEEICRDLARADPRVRYVRQRRNIGSAANHNLVAELAEGELFKWVSHDDTYSPDLLERCVAALDRRPEVVVSHCWTATIDETSTIRDRFRYTLATESRCPPERFHSLLFDVGGDDIYGVVRMEAMRRALPYGSYYRADRTIVAALALQGPFHVEQDWLFQRREHSRRATRTSTVRSWCATMDPRRANRLRHPTARLLLEYAGGYVSAIRGAPLTARDRLTCYRHLLWWMATRSRPRRLRREEEPRPQVVPWPEMVDELVPGRPA